MDALQIPKLPVARLLEHLIRWMHLNMREGFQAIASFIVGLVELTRSGLLSVPPLGVIAAIGVLAYQVAGIRTAVFACAGLLVVWDLRLWSAAMETLALVLVAGAMSAGLGIAAGILAGESRTARVIITPILDYMQTTPSFVYLIPSVLFFGLGTAPGVLATVMFALPPPVRTTALGIQQVNREVIEAGEAFGCTRWQLLRKVKLPLAIPSILLGVNQCIMMSFSMVVIAALIGARGLGTAVVESVTRVEVSKGVEAGLAVVLLAMVLDRVTRGAGRRAERAWL